jgi:uncharacterized protein YggU (UPF0235/DUF167 family)
MARLWVRLTPRGGADRVEGVDDEGRLSARVRAAPADGAANEALLRLIADELGLALRDVKLVRGASARVKLVEVVGPTAEVLAARWPGLRLA